MHHERLHELFELIGDDDWFLPMIAMVLKQRSDRLTPEVATELVSYLLNCDSGDVYAYIAAAASHPSIRRPTKIAGLASGCCGTVLLTGAAPFTSLLADRDQQLRHFSWSPARVDEID